MDNDEQNKTDAVPAPPETENENTAAVETKPKTRRCWTLPEEELFFVIWGRDNWRLTKHGKNTVVFAAWAEEMKERHNIVVNKEEVQAKVNQTRAKFRAVQKQLRLDNNTTKWRKFDLINKILRNQYRPKDAEPLPEGLNNRDRLSPELENNHSSATNSTFEAPVHTMPITGDDMEEEQQMKDNNNMVNSAAPSEHAIAAELFNNSHNTSNYSEDLYSTQLNKIKEEEINNEYIQAYQYQANYAEPVETDSAPQLHQLQTPHQQQLHQQHMHQQYQATPEPPQYHQLSSNGTTPPLMNPEQHHMQMQQEPHLIQQEAQQLHAPPPPPPGYDHSANNYMHMNHNNGTGPPMPPQTNNQNHYDNTTVNNNASTPPGGYINPAAPPNQYNINNYAVIKNNSNELTPSAVRAPRKRGPKPSPQVPMGTAVPIPGADTLESIYIDEVRKKNRILDEQANIERKRTEIEERKVNLFEQYFPKFLEMQGKILDKLERRPDC